MQDYFTYITSYLCFIEKSKQRLISIHSINGVVYLFLKFRAQRNCSILMTKECDDTVHRVRSLLQTDKSIISY